MNQKSAISPASPAPFLSEAFPVCGRCRASENAMVKFGHLKMFSVARSIEKHVSVHSFFTYNLGFALKFSAIFALNVFAESHRTGARATVNRKSIAHALRFIP